jgi:hypothetical protein
MQDPFLASRWLHAERACARQARNCKVRGRNCTGSVKAPDTVPDSPSVAEASPAKNLAWFYNDFRYSTRAPFSLSSRPKTCAWL